MKLGAYEFTTVVEHSRNWSTQNVAQVSPQFRQTLVISTCFLLKRPFNYSSIKAYGGMNRNFAPISTDLLVSKTIDDESRLSWRNLLLRVSDTTRFSFSVQSQETKNSYLSRQHYSEGNGLREPHRSRRYSSVIMRLADGIAFIHG